MISNCRAKRWLSLEAVSAGFAHLRECARDQQFVSGATEGDANVHSAYSIRR